MQFLGIEIGPSATHALVLDLDLAETLTECHIPHTWIDGLPPGYREQEPTTWFQTIDSAIRTCLNHNRVIKQKIASIGIAGPQRGFVLLDSQDRVIRPSKLDGDTSVKSQADEIAKAFGGSPGLLELLGQTPASHSAAAEFLWLKQHEPFHTQRAKSLLSIQDFITYWLTGERATEAGTASTTGLFDIRQRKWCQEIINFIHPPLAGLLPPLATSDHPRGTLRPALAKQWGLSDQVQVSPASAAPQLTTLAAGCTKNGSIAINLSSSSAVHGVGSHPVIDLRDELHPLCSATLSWLAIAESNNITLATESLKRHYGCDITDLDQLIASAPPGADGLLMLPYFTPESVPRLPESSGVLHGITPANFTPAHLARAAAEGVALSLAYALSRFRDLSFDPPEIRILGPASRNPTFRQILADALGTTLIPISSPHSPAFGAAIQSAISYFHNYGESLDYEEICSYLVIPNIREITTPDPHNQQLYTNLLARQQYLVDTLHPAGFL
jgi:xylulokinase